MSSSVDLFFPGVSCVSALVFIAIGIYAANKAAKCTSSDKCNKSQLGMSAGAAFCFALLLLSASVVTMILMKG